MKLALRDLPALGQPLIVLGAILAVSGYIGWFRVLFPHEKIESVPVVNVPPRVITSRMRHSPGKRVRSTCLSSSSLLQGRSR